MTRDICFSQLRGPRGRDQRAGVDGLWGASSRLRRPPSWVPTGLGEGQGSPASSQGSNAMVGAPHS